MFSFKPSHCCNFMQKIGNVSCTHFWYYLKNLISGPYLAHFSPKTFFPKKTFPPILSLYAAKKSFSSILRSYASATWRNLILAWKPPNKIFSKVNKIEVIIRFYAAMTYAKNSEEFLLPQNLCITPAFLTWYFS